MTKPTALALLLATAAMTASAKLPPLDDAAKAKAAETTAKTAWTTNVANYQLCRSMERVAAEYFAESKQAGKPTQPPVATPACTDPGPFAYLAPSEAKPPIEASGAHSPARTAAQPPSSTTPDAQANPKK